MGGIAIWCMHYIGNRATVLGGGQSVLQIAYNPGFTALSFFVPILVLLVAFTALGSNDRVSIIRVSLGGTLAGSAICGMHYLGQEGISNYTCVYNIGNVVGSAAIAVTASVVALSVFFVLRATWTNSWWKRALCAIVLAGAVSGMHWLASVGTHYRLKHVDTSSSYDSISRISTVIVVIVLVRIDVIPIRIHNKTRIYADIKQSVAACFILLIFTMLAQRRRSRSANRAQEVVLACAIFDPNGRIMVTPDGVLPNRKVTTSYVERVRSPSDDLI
jgi:NO-binding membrane sensor protein with MHYT domain